MRNNYETFLADKRLEVAPSGFDPGDINPMLFDFQRDAVAWACRLGRAALWEDCGLGKTAQSIEWAAQVTDHTGRPVLILTPLAVAPQFVSEGEKFGVRVDHARDGGRVQGPRIVVANYERLHRFSVSDFSGVVLDESSILKNFTGKVRTQLIETFADTPYRLACTATPAPNDFVELGNHAQFLGVMSRAEMLARFFVHDGGSTKDWRLKGHAAVDFWSWLASWALNVRKPSDLGYEDNRFKLPDLLTHEHVVTTTHDTAKERGLLFNLSADTLLEQRRARKATISQRVAIAAELANEIQEPWVMWCELNDESSALAAAIPGAVEVRGSQTTEQKEELLASFSSGRTRVLVTKPSIAGWGMNWQHCAHVAFVGIGHSFEMWYQAIRRTWRFGQARQVHCHIITSDLEGAVLENLRRKQSDAERMAGEMVAAMGEINRAAVRGSQRTYTGYDPQKEMAVPEWLKSKVAK